MDNGGLRFLKARCADSVVPALVVDGVVRGLVVPIARGGLRGCMRDVVSLNARCAGRDSMPVWSAPAGGDPNHGGWSAEHAHAADRFAREIVRILTGFLLRSRRLMGKPLGRCPSTYYLIKR